MMRTRWNGRNLSVIVALLAVAVVGASLLAQDGAEISKETKQLGGPDRARAFLSTDKPIYRTGETVWARTVIVEAMKGAPQNAHTARFSVLSPRGETIFKAQGRVDNGIGPFHWQVPASVPGGEYKLRVEFPSNGYPPAERTFDIRAYRVPRFRTQIEFGRKGYGPGDEVTAVLD
jgi:uncharacterized protein YfaS (alpha-2-macroglobulin family)